MNDFSDLDEKTPVELGLHGYCYLALPILYELYPKMSIFRLTDGSDFCHVFLGDEKGYVDIRGRVTKEDIMKGFEDCFIEPTTLEDIEKYFLKIRHATYDERIYVRKILRRYIYSVFRDNPKALS